ncbi:MAG TPA: nitronate monooxygenase family protein [Verrucomicrobiae bacterium]|nr:nitronate monooxygenase family protein [Verrucomicrobiae bacterium]
MSLPDILRERLALPAIGAPMFIVSVPELVIAQCKAGVVGSFPSLNARPAEELEKWLKRIRDELARHDNVVANGNATSDGAGKSGRAAPFAVNLIVHKSNDRLANDLELCVRYQAPIVITSLGAREDVNQAVHSYGGIVLHDVINNVFAHKAVDKGADGLIAVAAGAGGHAGTTSPFALVQEIREWWDGPLVLSGAIAAGGAVVAAQAMGADLAYIGSAFIATREANAPDGYKQMIVESSAADIVYSNYFSGVLGNYLKPSIARAGFDPENLPQADPSKMNFADTDGKVKAWRDIWSAGQGIGAVKQVVSVAELVARLTREYNATLEKLASGAVKPAVQAPVTARR